MFQNKQVFNFLLLYTTPVAHDFLSFGLMFQQAIKSSVLVLFYLRKDNALSNSRQGMARGIDSKREYLKSIISDILQEKDDAYTVDSLDDSMSLTTDLGLDSLDLAEMTVRLEDQYGIDVYEEDVVDEIGEVLEKLD